MQIVRLAHETDAEGWRRAARDLRGRGVAPESVVWTVDGAAGPFACANEDGPPPDLSGGTPFSVPKGFLDLAAEAILHRSDERFALLYRLLWRFQAEPVLLRRPEDPDVARALELARAVGRAAHQMKAFVRFRTARDALGEAQVAWFEPAQRVAQATAPFFARRLRDRRFAILTPDVCVHWNGRDLAFTPGADPADAPREDVLEDYWRARHAGVFPPRP